MKHINKYSVLDKCFKFTKVIAIKIHSFLNSPILILPPFSPLIAILKPSPSSPIRLEAGTSQSSNITARVGWEFHPTCKQNKKNLNNKESKMKKNYQF